MKLFKVFFIIVVGMALVALSGCSSLQTKNCKGKVCYAGYSSDFLKTKKLLNAGKADVAYKKLQAKQSKSKKKPNFLYSLESALLALDANNLEQAIKHLAVAESLLKERNRSTKTEDAGKKLLEELIKFTGASEFGPYDGEAFERILMLNYKSIAHMLKGERAAYNVTRRAIDQQNIEKRAFDIKMASVKKSTDKKMKEAKKEQAKKKKGKKTNPNDIFSVVAQQFEQSKSKALEVPSAFVNPFGFYMAGIVQEFDSFEDKSLRDNARISYKKALALNPGSKILKQAVQEIQKPAAKGKRLVQIVVADGFAPEKKVVRFDVHFGATLIPIKLPFYDGVKSAVDKIEIQSIEGKRIASLSTVSDIEAIVMRHQLDSLPEQYLRVALDIARVLIESKVYDAAVGGTDPLIKEFFQHLRAETVNPDTRSWLTLPKQIMGARLTLPKDVNKLVLVSYDSAGKVLAKRSVTLEKFSHNFIYARTINKIMTVSQSEKLWIALK